MNIPRRQFLHLAASAAGLLALLGVAWGQAYPTRPVRILLWLRSIPSTKPDMHRLRLPIHLPNHSIGATFHTASAHRDEPNLLCRINFTAAFGVRQTRSLDRPTQNARRVDTTRRLPVDSLIAALGEADPWIRPEPRSAPRQ